MSEREEEGSENVLDDDISKRDSLDLIAPSVPWCA